MDILTLEKVLQAKTIPALSRVVGKSFNEYDDLNGLKRGIIAGEGVQRSVKICEDKEEEIASIIGGIHAYNTDQQEFIDLLNAHNIVGVPQEPVVEENKREDVDPKIIEECANRIYNAMAMANSDSMTPEDVKKFVTEHIQKELKDLLTTE
jgi:hypothetical protein